MPINKSTKVDRGVNMPPFLLNSGNIYYGEWKKGLRHGKGVEHNIDGTFFEGIWIDDVPIGYGRHVFVDNSYLEGKFENNLCNINYLNYP